MSARLHYVFELQTLIAQSFGPTKGSSDLSAWRSCNVTNSPAGIYCLKSLVAANINLWER